MHCTACCRKKIEMGIFLWEFLRKLLWLSLPERPDRSEECLLQESNRYLHAVPWTALLFLLLRSFMERYVFQWVGERLCGISDQWCPPPADNAVLSKAFAAERRPSEEQKACLAEEVEWTPYRVHKWFWRARNCQKASKLTKFKESSWRFVFYTAAVLNGLITLSREPFFWDLSRSYEGYPNTDLSSSVQSYWCLEFAFYCSQLVTHITDVRRKDFLQSLVHHAATVALLSLCHSSHMLPLGCLILLTHDVSDVLLELAKVLHYSQQEGAARVVFAMFAVVFFITRLVIFPVKLLWSAVLSLPAAVGWFPGYREGVALLVLLQMLHVYWFWLVVRMAVRMARGRPQRDVRSDSELSPSSH